MLRYIVIRFDVLQVSVYSHSQSVEMDPDPGGGCCLSPLWGQKLWSSSQHIAGIIITSFDTENNMKNEMLLGWIHNIFYAFFLLIVVSIILIFFSRLLFWGYLTDPRSLFHSPLCLNLQGSWILKFWKDFYTLSPVKSLRFCKITKVYSSII